MTRYVLLVVCVLSTCFGHVLFKSTANTSKGLSSFWLLAFEPIFIVTVFLYGITTFGWIWCLQEIPLSRAYLFMSLAYVFIPLFSWYWFGETINLQYIISTMLILGGILLAIK